ncbi:UNVERIFIED_CONTAM: hypothetical protein ABIC26_004188 [Paenibacillus sp. PvR008]
MSQLFQTVCDLIRHTLSLEANRSIQIEYKVHDVPPVCMSSSEYLSNLLYLTPSLSVK